MSTGCRPSAEMSSYILAKLRLSLISNCSSPSAPPVSLPVYLLSWSPMPVETPAGHLGGGDLHDCRCGTGRSPREETVIPAKGRKMR